MVLYMDASSGTAKLTGYAPPFTPVTLNKVEQELNKEEYEKNLSEHNRIVDLITDSTLKKYMERMRPELDDNQYFPSVDCTDCGSAFPCEDYEFIAEDLKRRQATDPFINEGGVPSLSEGAL